MLVYIKFDENYNLISARRQEIEIVKKKKKEKERKQNNHAK